MRTHLLNRVLSNDLPRSRWLALLLLAILLGSFCWLHSPRAPQCRCNGTARLRASSDGIGPRKAEAVVTHHAHTHKSAVAVARRRLPIGEYKVGETGCFLTEGIPAVVSVY